MLLPPSYTIGIDARLSGKKHAGIGRYIENLLLNLPLIGVESGYPINWVYFFNNREQAQTVQTKLEQFNQLKFVYAPIRHYSLAEQTHWPQLIKKQQLDLLHVPHFNIPLCYQGRLVVTIHDLLWHQQIGPEVTTLSNWKYYLKYLAYRWVTNRAVKKAHSIYVPAKTVRNTLTTYYPQSLPKIKVTKEGISQLFIDTFLQIKDQDETNFSNQTNPNQLIYVGSLYPHKNIQVVLEALTQKPSLKLILVCARNVFMLRTQELVDKLQISDQVEFTGYLTDKQLIQKIQTSLALIQPSRSEGFGLTGIEAMACGTPVIASEIDVFKEVYKQAPVYFNPKSVFQLLQAINTLKKQTAYSQHIQAGFKVVDQYNWRDMATIIFNDYLDILT